MGGVTRAGFLFSLLRARLRGTPLVIATACRSSHRTHARRHQLTEIALPDGCRVPYGGGLRRAQQVIRGRTAVTLDECDAALAARGVQTRGDHRLRRARRRGGRYYLLPSGGRRRRCRVGGALPMTNIRLIVKHGCSHAQPCSGASLGTPLPPRCRGRGALFDLGYYLASGGRRRRCRGGGELPGGKRSPHSPRWRLAPPAVHRARRRAGPRAGPSATPSSCRRGPWGGRRDNTCRWRVARDVERSGGAAGV